jgi:hypothetical protein
VRESSVINRTGRRLATAACYLVLLACMGCESKVGKGPTGHSIRGTVRYQGTRAKQFSQPLWLVGAETSLSSYTTNSPYATDTGMVADLSQPIPYELRLLLPGRYYVVGIVGDLARFDQLTSPRGAYPNSCILLEMPAERSVAMEDQDLENVDIAIYDEFADDPCAKSAQPPAVDGGSEDGGGTAGAGELDTLVSAATVVGGPGDALSVALFAGMPGLGDPTYIKQVSNPSFPVMVKVEGVTPGDYTIVVCFQKAGSASSICMGPDDRLAFYPSLSTRTPIGAGQPTIISVELTP